jgi:hypothetical protein
MAIDTNLLTMYNKDKKELETAKITLDSDLNKNKISKMAHSKGLCSLVYEYSISGFIDESINLYLTISKNYIQDKLHEDLMSDNEFFIKMNTWFELVSYAGHVPYDIMATQKGATA